MIYIGEIRMFGCSWAPKEWALCNGDTLPMTSNPALYSLIGTQFGGDGTTTFKLPDLRGRVPVHIGTDYSSSYGQGQMGGQEHVTLTEHTLANHFHTLNATSDAGTGASAKGGASLLAHNTQGTEALYGSAASLVDMSAASVSQTGGGQPHANMQPTTVINFCIALHGSYPSRN